MKADVILPHPVRTGVKQNFPLLASPGTGTTNKKSSESVDEIISGPTQKKGKNRQAKGENSDKFNFLFTGVLFTNATQKAFVN